MPVRMFISVDLPAPFSPSKAWISPGITSRSTSWLATTPGKYLAMPFISTIGGVPGSACSAVSGTAFIGMWPDRNSETADAFDRPIPVVELVLGHAVACSNLDVALGILDLALERAPAAEHLGPHVVGLLGDFGRDCLAPGVAIDAGAHPEERLTRRPLALEPHAYLLDVIFLEV